MRGALGAWAVLLVVGMLPAFGCARSRFACADGSCRARGEDAGPSAEVRDAGGGRDAGRAPNSGAGQGAGAVAGAGGGTGGAPACAPWYKCVQECRRLELIGGGRAIGACTGDCRFELAIEPVFYAGKRDCLLMNAQLTVRDSRGGSRTIAAALSEPAWERLTSISNALEALRGMPAGCAECEGGNEAWIALASAAEFIHYERGNPPPALREADTFVQALIDQLASCSGDFIEQCRDDESACRFTYTNPERQTQRECSVGLDDPSPCMTALRCLCGGDVLPETEGQPLDACVEHWLTPRGAPTLVDLCASSSPSATRTLFEAMTEFANAHGGSVTMNEGLCGMIPAFY